MKLHKNLATALLFIFILISFSNVAQNTHQLRLQAQRLKTVPGSASRNHETIRVLIQGDASLKQRIPQMGGLIYYCSKDIYAVEIATDKLYPLAQLHGVKRIEAGTQILQTLNDTTRVKTQVEKVHAGLSPLTQAYTGNGVVMGIIDTGIDFSHPDFKDNTGKSRVAYLWDQALPTGINSPMPFNYGQEFSAADIDNGLAASHKDETQWGHGTHVSGIAAGNGLANGYHKGMAPDATLIMVALDFNSNSATLISDACKYIFDKADSLGMPCVINISVGDYYGSHDAKDLQAQTMTQLLDEKPGRVIVAAAGNAGHLPIHLSYPVTQDTSFTWYKSSNGYVYMEIWADTANFNQVQYGVSADATNPYKQRSLPTFKTIHTNLDTLIVDTLYSINGNRLGIREQYAERMGDSYMLQIGITVDSTNYQWRLNTLGQGKFDAWSFDFVSSGLPDTLSFPAIKKYRLPDYFSNMVSSFQCSEKVITVANYIGKSSYVNFLDQVINTGLISGDIGNTSSKGPTRKGLLKPDLAAPGNNNLSAVVLSLKPQYEANGAVKLAKGGLHVRNGGTSMASPVVAGIAALMLEQQPQSTYQQIKSALTNCAIKDNFTGATSNTTWGHGKVNAFAAMTNCLITTSLEEGNTPLEPILYPNPSFGNVQVSNLPPQVTLSLLNMQGQLLQTWRPQHKFQELQIGHLNKAIYLLQAVDNKGLILWTKKIVLL